MSELQADEESPVCRVCRGDMREVQGLHSLHPDAPDAQMTIFTTPRSRCDGHSG
jgi:hypothetical protein